MKKTKSSLKFDCFQSSIIKKRWLPSFPIGFEKNENQKRKLEIKKKKIVPPKICTKRSKKQLESIKKMSKRSRFH